MSDYVMGQRICLMRKTHNMTMEELGQKLGVGRSAVNKWEKGTVQNIPRETIEKMAKIFDCSVAWLMGYEETINWGKVAKEIIQAKTSIVITDEHEKQIIQKYREADEKKKIMILLALGIDYIPRLNPLIKYSTEIKAKEQTIPPEDPHTRYYGYGRAARKSSKNPDKIKIRRKKVTE